MKPRYKTLEDNVAERMQKQPSLMPTYLEVAFEESLKDGNWLSFYSGALMVAEAGGLKCGKWKRKLTILRKTARQNDVRFLGTALEMLREMGFQLSLNRVLPAGGELADIA